MEHDTPHDWLLRAAERDPLAPALMTGDGDISYADLEHRVTVRARSLARKVRTGEIVAVRVHLDPASVIEILAVMRVGAVVAPYASSPPILAGSAPEGAALCVATSGSKGASKIVPLSYENLSASVAASKARLGNGADDRWLAALPLHHIGGISVLLRSFEAGGASVLSPFGPDTAAAIERFTPTIVSAVPTMVYRLLEHAPDSLASVGIVLTGGARLTSQLREKASAHGVALLPTYGMTEAASQIATAIPGIPTSGGDVVGPPLDGFSVSIRTAQGFAVPGEVGVIEVEGPAVFGGYLDGPRRSGAHRTADVGFIDPDGSLGVIGRIDDVIVTGGENVSLTGVALAIEGITGVRDAVVVGVPDREWGTAICALVELEQGTLRGEVMDELAVHLAPHAVPRRVDIGVVPLLDNGKHDLAAVRSRFDAR